jgi:hypothetical protein
MVLTVPHIAATVVACYAICLLSPLSSVVVRLRQPLWMIFGGTVFEDHILALDVAQLIQPFQ